MDEWGSPADVEQETIRAIVDGYAERRIDLGKTPSNANNSNTRLAPCFIAGKHPGGSQGAPYSSEMLRKFLGWVSSKYKPPHVAQNVAQFLSGTKKGLAISS